LIRVEGKLVQFNVAALAGKGIWAGGKTVDTATVCELKGVGGDFFLRIEEDFAEIGGGEVEEVSPELAIFEIKAGLDFVAG
jgi:hypothetical protein